MSELSELVNDCYLLESTPILTDIELDYITLATEAIEGLEWPMAEAANEVVKKVNPEDAKKSFLKMVLLTIKKIKQKPELLNKITKKAEEIKSDGLSTVKEMYTNLMKDKTFLNPFIKEVTEIAKPIAKINMVTSAATLVVILAVIIIIAFINNPAIVAIKFILVTVLPNFMKVIGKTAITSLFLISLETATPGIAAAKSIGISGILKDIVSVIKQLKIKDIKNKFKKDPKLLNK